MNWTDLATILGGIIAVLSAIFAICRWIYNIGFKKGRSELSYTRDKEMLTQVYAPLVALMLDMHISTCTIIRYPNFSQRLHHGVELFKNRWKFKSGIRAFWYAIFDKGDSNPAIGIEYGHSFPLKKIGDVISSKTHLCSPILIQRYRRILQNNYGSEVDSSDELSIHHLELFEHIFDEHKRLTMRVTSTI